MQERWSYVFLAQAHRYWLCRIIKSVSFTKTNFIYSCHFGVKKLCKMQMWDIYILQINLAHKVLILMPRQNGCDFADDAFKCIFLNDKVKILIKTSLEFLCKCPINNIPALVDIMAWCQPCDKPLFEPVMFSLLTHICVTRPQWVNTELLVSWVGNICFLMNI